MRTIPPNTLKMKKKNWLFFSPKKKKIIFRITMKSKLTLLKLLMIFSVSLSQNSSKYHHWNSFWLSLGQQVRTLYCMYMRNWRTLQIDAECSNSSHVFCKQIIILILIAYQYHVLLQLWFGTPCKLFNLPYHR